jgi:hypothetical protein
MSTARGKRSTTRSKSPDMTKGETPGLRQIVQNRFLKDVFESAAGTSPVSSRKKERKKSS